MEHFDNNVKYRASLQNYVIDTGEAIFADKLSIVYDDLYLTRSTQNTIWPTDDYFVLDEGTGNYICSICGYVYDPDEHDGVAFEDLPDDWKCPRCKQSKEKFSKA